jgi:predicted dithiol-disulfide oxidoreductase (DUF899 family)
VARTTTRADQRGEELARHSDEVARHRQALPWVPIDKEYRFETDTGDAAPADLFSGRSQLLVYHFMFGPDYKAGCPSCSSIADGFNGIAIHLANHDVMLWAVSRAPLDGDRVVSIHDFLFARYAMDGVDLSPLNPAPRS